MNRWFRKNKRVIATIICILLALALMLGSLAPFFF